MFEDDLPQRIQKISKLDLVFLKNRYTNKFNYDNYFISDTIFWQNEIESIGIIYATIQIKILKSYKDMYNKYRNKCFNYSWVYHRP